MGKRNSQQRKHVAMLDSDDDSSSVSSSSSSVRSDRMPVSGTEEVVLDRDSLLDQALDALYEKRAATREKALAVIIDAFNTNLQHEFVESKFVTLLHCCVNSIKKGSSKEIALACRTIGLLALTVGPGDSALEILEESVTPISQNLKSGAELVKTVSLLDCLAIITFVGGNDPAQTERAMQIVWQLVHPKQGSNVVAVKPSAPLISAVVSAWAFLLTTMDRWTLNPKDWQESISYFSGLLERDDRSVRIAAGEALAVIFEMGSLEKFAGDIKSSDESSTQEGKAYAYIQGLKTKLLNQVRSLSSEAGGKGSAKKDLNNQRNLFKDVLEFLMDGYSPEFSMKIGGDLLQTSTWAGLIQLNFLKRFLGSGFVKHMQDNDFLQDVFGFMPKRKQGQGAEHQLSASEKRMYRSPNSALNKARTQFLNKQRMLSEGRNAGHFAANAGDDV